MYKKYEIHLKTKRVEFDLTIQQKYNILRGDSGTGKTRLAYLVQKAVMNKDIQLVCDLPVKTVTDVEVFFLYLESNIKAIYILDDIVCNELKGYNIGDLTKNNRGYFIFITRRSIGGIDSNSADIYYMKRRHDIGSKTYYYLETKQVVA